MSIAVNCHICAANFAVKDGLAGKLVRCPECQADIVVAGAAPAKSPGKEKKPAPATLPVDPEVVAERKQKLHAIFGFVGAFFLQILGGIVFRYGYDTIATQLAPGPGYLMMFIGGVFLVLCFLLYIWACYSYADADGYPRVIGLLGLLGCCGFPLVWLIVRIGGKRTRPAPAADADDEDDE